MNLEKYRNEKGFVVIPCRAVDTISMGGVGVCDWCSKASLDGFLIPVLGTKYSCTECKEDWEKRAVYYLEDSDYETSCAERLLNRLNVSN